MRLTLLSDLHLCSVPSAILEPYEADLWTDVTQWLHHHYQRYAVYIHDLGKDSHQHCIPLLDLTITAGDEPLLFTPRAPKDAANMFPQRNNSCRLIIFPQTRFSFIEDQVHRSSLYPKIHLVTSFDRSSSPSFHFTRSNSGSCHTIYYRILEGQQDIIIPSLVHSKTTLFSAHTLVRT